MFSDPIHQAFLVIVLLAAVVAFILAYTAAKKKASLELRVGLSASEASAELDGELEKYFQGPSRKLGEIKQTIAKTIEQKVEEKLQIKTGEICERYEHIISEKDQSIQFVEKQFQNVSERYQKLDSIFKDLGEEKKQTEEVVRSMAEGVIMVNKKGEVILMNPAAEKMLGINKSEKLGKSILDDLKDEHLVSLTQEQDISGKKEKEIVVQSRNDQTQKVLRASNAIIESEDGKTVGFVSVLSDVTKQKELDSLKNTFLTNISHDLRTPLTCIQGSLALLCDKTISHLTPDQERIAMIALNNSKRLTRLINDLLDLSKLEAKKFTIKPSLFRIDQLIRAIAEEFGAWGKSKDIAVLAEAPNALEIEGDQDRIGQVLNNLVGNAMKFTPNGGKVIIEGKLSASPERIEIGVRDSGPGISKKDFKKLFEKFEQLDTPTLQGVSGTGLGLAIAKEIVELHKGRIWVESEEGKGSRFAFELPVKQG